VTRRSTLVGGTSRDWFGKNRHVQIGQEVFVFVDFSSQLAVHIFGIGSFTAGIGPAGSMSPFFVTNANNAVELEGEQLRVDSGVQAPSRLDCLYVYDSLDPMPLTASSIRPRSCFPAAGSCALPGNMG
jgi:hypothetical protein